MTLSAFAVDCARDVAISATDGMKMSLCNTIMMLHVVTNVTLANVLVQYTNGWGMEVRGYNNTVRDATARETGCGGISLSGGDQVCNNV